MNKAFGGEGVMMGREWWEGMMGRDDGGEGEGVMVGGVMVGGGDGGRG